MTCPVTVIMPAYNVTRYIATALDSVFLQTMQNFKIIVVNDGCPDTANLEQALQPYRSRITYIRQENGGVGAARKTAVLAADTPWIAQLDPDDWWQPNYLETQFRLLESNPTVDLIYADAIYFGNKALEGKSVMDYNPSEGEVTFSRLMLGLVNINSSALIRRETILKAGNFDDQLRTAEDFDLWARILKTGGRVAYHRTPLYHYRLRPDSLTSSPNDAQAWLLRVLDKLESTLPLTTEEKLAIGQRRTAAQMEAELQRGKDAIRRKRWRQAIWHLELYRRYRPSGKLSAVLFLLRFAPIVIRTGIVARDALLQKGFLKAGPPQQA